MLEVGRQGFGPRSHHHTGGSRGKRGLFRMLRAYPPVAGAAVAAVGHKVGGLHFHHRNVGDELFMLTDRLQVSSTIRTAMQFRFLRLTDLHYFGQFSMSKFPFPRFAPRTSRLLHPVPPRERRRLPLPEPFQVLDLLLQSLHHLLQPFHLLLQFLVQFQRLRQLFLQFTDLLVFRPSDPDP
jgi:hypothetical protein